MFSSPLAAGTWQAISDRSLGSSLLEAKTDVELAARDVAAPL